MPISLLFVDMRGDLIYGAHNSPADPVPMNNRRTLRILCLSLAVVTAITAGFLSVTRIVFFRHYEGIFLLRGVNGKKFQLQDDLYLGDGSRLIAGIEFERLENWFREVGHGPADTYLTYEWNKDDGEGYLISHFPGGKKLRTNFSRYEDSYGLQTHGLFVGGALAESARADSPDRQADSGMAWFDGTRWYHIWCNTNEGIASADSGNRYPPHRWQFVGSRTLIADDDKLVIASRHLIDIDQTQLRMERFVYAAAGNPYLSLGIALTNAGAQPIRYNYLYADEPWLGDFDTSAGDIGWVEGGLIYTEGFVDPQRHYYAGMTDRGNPMLGEQGPYTGVANFIAWSDGTRPDTVYFANDYRGFNHPPELLVPLAGDARSIGLAWNKRLIRPGETHKIFLRLGIAALNPQTNLPTVPPLRPLPDFRALGVQQ